MSWNQAKARKWLKAAGGSHIKDGLEPEGKFLIAFSDFEVLTENSFRQALARTLWWNDDHIDAVVLGFGL